MKVCHRVFSSHQENLNNLSVQYSGSVYLLVMCWTGTSSFLIDGKLSYCVVLTMMMLLCLKNVTLLSLWVRTHWTQRAAWKMNHSNLLFTAHSGHFDSSVQTLMSVKTGLFLQIFFSNPIKPSNLFLYNRRDDLYTVQYNGGKYCLSCHNVGLNRFRTGTALI